jgi:hypothetical protein
MVPKASRTIDRSITVGRRDAKVFRVDRPKKLTKDNTKTGVRLSSEQISLPKLQIHVADFRSTLSPTNVKL